MPSKVDYTLMLMLRSLARIFVSLPGSFLIFKVVNSAYLLKSSPSRRKAHEWFRSLLFTRRLHLVQPASLMDIDITCIDHGSQLDDREPWLPLMAQIIHSMGALSGEHTHEPDHSPSPDQSTPDAIWQLINTPDHHYSFLRAAVRAIGARRVVEVGTASGLSAACFLMEDSVSRVDSFDLISLEQNHGWGSTAAESLTRKYLSESMGRFEQHVTDLTDDINWERHRHLFASANLIFVDAVHDGNFEKILCERLLEEIDGETLLVFDDIRLGAMIAFWTNLPMDRFDVGQLGHISGTGLARLRS